MPTTNFNRSLTGFVRSGYIFRNRFGVVASQANDSTPVGLEVQAGSKTWVRTPNYWSLRRSNSQLPENSFSYNLRRRSSGTLHAEDTYFNSDGATWWYLDSPNEWWAAMPNTGHTLGVFDLYSRLAQRARNSNFSLPIALLEGRRTAQMVADTARLLAGGISDLRRGNLVGFANRLGLSVSSSQTGRFNRRYGRDPGTTAANYWLQYQYGWKPLLADCKNAAEAVAELMSRDETKTCSVSASVRSEVAILHENFTLGVSPEMRGRVLARDKISRKGVWRFKPNSSDIPGLFGLVNPFEVVWEVIPFSFVADWFLPIGNYLSALDLPLRFSHVGGSTGYRRVQQWDTWPTYASYSSAFPGTTKVSGHAFVEEVMVTRTPLSGPPTPSISDMVFEAKLGASRVTSALALLTQQASRLRR